MAEPNFLSERNQLGEKCFTIEILDDNNSGAKTLIEFDNNKSLDIKEEIIEGMIFD